MEQDRNDKLENHYKLILKNRDYITFYFSYEKNKNWELVVLKVGGNKTFKDFDNYVSDNPFNLGMMYNYITKNTVTLTNLFKLIRNKNDFLGEYLREFEISENKNSTVDELLSLNLIKHYKDKKGFKYAMSQSEQELTFVVDSKLIKSVENFLEFISNLDPNDQELVSRLKDNPKALSNIGLLENIEIQDFINSYNDILKNDKDGEIKIQNLFKDNVNVLKKILGEPMLDDEWFKYLDQTEETDEDDESKNGKKKGTWAILDFSNKTKNGKYVIIEFKMPKTPLICSGKKECRFYRSGNGERVYRVSTELNAVTQQALYQKHKIYSNFSKEGEIFYKFYNYKLYVFIGDQEREFGYKKDEDEKWENEDKKRTFELYRNTVNDIQIITYDELLNKAKLLIKSK